MRNWIKLSTMLLLGTSCKTLKVEIHDSEWCVSKGELGARCNWMKGSAPPRSMDKDKFKEWAKGKATTDISTLINLRATIKKLCSDNQTSCYFVKDEVEAADKNLARIIETGK